MGRLTSGRSARGGLGRPTIGMLTTSLVNLFHRQWLGVVDGAQEAGVNLIGIPGCELRNPEAFKAEANVVYDLISPDRFDGLVVWMTPLQLYVGQERMEAFLRRYEPLPMVSVEQVFPGHASILMDNRSGLRDVVSHLIEVHGHRRIAFVRGPDNHPGAQERYQGYLDALATHGLEADPALVTPAPRTWEPADAAAAVHRLLDEFPGGVDAFAAANDDLALGVLAALRERGVHVPAEVAVVGYDDAMSIVPHALGLESADVGGVALTRAVNISAATMPLTTVRAPFAPLGKRAVELLVGQIEGESVPAVETLAAELVVRRSCGCVSPRAWRDAPRPGSGTDIAAREQVAAELRQRLTLPPDVSASDWAEQLLAAYAAAVEEASAAVFLEVVDELVRETMRVSGRLSGWWPVLSALRQTAPSKPTDDSRAFVESLWLDVQASLGELADHFSAYREYVSAKLQQIIRETGQSVVTALDVEEIAAALADSLAQIGIPSCYVSSYLEQHDRPTALVYPTENAQALLVYGHEQRVQTEEVFPSRRLVPGDHLKRPDPFSAVLLPLHFQDEQLGFALFELGPRIGTIYQALAEQLSSALQGARLVERERLALARVEEANEALKRARDDLEERVLERTAELAHANEVLTAEILERERAEQMQERLEAQLRQMQKMEAIGRLAGGIAHDINNVLVVINGYTDLMLRAAADDDPQRLDLEQIQRAGEQAANLTRQLLAFSRQQVLQPIVLDLNDVIATVQQMLERLIGDDIALVTSLATQLSPIRADVNQIEQVVLNLAVNARDAMPEGGRLTIETADVDLDEAYAREHVGVEPGWYVLLRVTDSGMGMDAETQARLFEPFFTTKAPGQGTGLGMATVFGIVQQSGGHIACSSEVGTGTTFEIYLPTVAEALAEVAPEPAPARASLQGSETILLVEDDPGVHGAIHRFLKAHGYQVLQAVDGQQALRLCAQYDGPVHLVVADVMMPGMRGPELVERLAHILPRTPVLYVSGYTDSGSIREALSEPSVALLQKPFTAEELARRVREMLDRDELGRQEPRPIHSSPPS